MNRQMTRRRGLAHAVLLIVGVLAIVAPASAHITQDPQHNWSRHYLPEARKSFFTKSQTDALYPRRANLRDAAGTINDTDNPVDWSQLKSVPDGFADGTDDVGSPSDPAWELAGNAGTDSATHFLGTTDDEPLNVKVNGQRALRLEPGSSPNVVAGHEANEVTSGVIGATVGGGGGSGTTNQVTDNAGTVGGGKDNRAGDGAGTAGDNQSATVGGGLSNTASRLASTVAGGGGNTAANLFASVLGGLSNDASGDRATAVGGEDNTASGSKSAVAGGLLNTASGDYSMVGGGEANRATALYAFVTGGVSNVASQHGAAIGGGTNNTASGDRSTVAGGGANSASGEHASVGGGETNAASGINSTVGGGESNDASALNSVVGGGLENDASGIDATVGGGLHNLALGSDATVAGGASNSASGNAAFVPGGAEGVAALYGQMAHASGRFSAPGDAQASEYVLRTSTSGTTIGTMFLDGSTASLTIEPGRTLFYQGHIVGRSSTGESAVFSSTGLIENVGGVTSFVDSGGAATAIGRDDTAWNVVASADNGNDRLHITVQGGAGDTVRWVAVLRAVEVKF